MIVDGFIFFNELDLLEIRLHELDEVVDAFILVESKVTFTGRSKELFFQGNRDRYARFLSKIRHVVVEDMPSGPDPWAREIH